MFWGINIYNWKKNQDALKAKLTLFTHVSGLIVHNSLRKNMLKNKMLRLYKRLSLLNDVIKPFDFQAPPLNTWIHSNM